MSHYVIRANHSYAHTPEFLAWVEDNHLTGYAELHAHDDTLTRWTGYVWDRWRTVARLGPERRYVLTTPAIHPWCEVDP